MKKKQNNQYFNKQTEQYILQYRCAEDPIQKQYIYTNHLHAPFTKIAVSLCKKYKIRQRIQLQQTVIQQCISVMMQKMSSFSSQRGKAFTFFTIVARNCILSNLNNRIKYNDRHPSIDDIPQGVTQTALLNQTSYSIWKCQLQEQYNKEIILKSIIRLQDQIINEILPNVTKETEKLVCYGILQLIRDVNVLVTLNRKTVLLYLRQITDLSTETITTVLNKIGIRYFKIKEDIIQNDVSLLEYQMLI